MHEAKPSRTALRVALRRAAHQLHDHCPLVFDDPLAVRILGTEHGKELERTPDSERRPFSAGMRAWMVGRARLAEDILAEGVRTGQTAQYLVLGAGLALMVLGPAVSAAAAGPAGIGGGRSAAGVGAVAMIVLQNKIIADWFTGRRFMWAISVSVAESPGQQGKYR